MFLDLDASRLMRSGPEIELPANLAVPVGYRRCRAGSR
jgi:hypothetical protein